MDNWQQAVLGRTGKTVGRLGLASSYGADARCVEAGFERGVNYFYWGSRRTASFGNGLRSLRSHRNDFTLVIQSYSRMTSLLSWSLRRALRSLQMDYADVLLLGYWNHGLSPRILDEARELRKQGLVQSIGVSTHSREDAVDYSRDPDVGVLHVRYNAIHSGAERDLFPHLAAKPGSRAGIVAFTATSWGQLMKPAKIPAGDTIPTAGDAYRFVLSNSSVDVCMTGPANLEQLSAALDARDQGPMTPEEYAWIKRVGEAKYGKKSIAAGGQP